MKHSSNRQSASKTVAYKLQMLGNYPDESIHHSEHGKSLKSRKGMKNWEQRKPVGYLTFTDHTSEPE